MRRPKIRIVTAECKRCGKAVATANRSIHGLDALKRQFGVVCESCTTPEEEREVLHAIGRGIQSRGN